MSVDNHNAVLDTIEASLATALTTRHVQGVLADPANLPREQLLAGVVCLVSKGGGGFANYRGREGDLGNIDVSLLCFVQVQEADSPQDVQRAELALLGELLQWVASGVAGVNAVYPGNWLQSKQLEHPYGWLVLDLQVKT